MNKKLRLCFFGSPVFAVPSLDRLYRDGHNILSVFSQSPKPANRGKKIVKQPVHEFAEKKNIEVLCPDVLDSNDIQNYLKNMELDVIVVVAYGKIIPSSILNIPRLGCINLHASLLPRWRGAAPIQRAIMAGDKATGISIMLMDEGLDSGPVLDVLEIIIQDSDNYMDLATKLSESGAEFLSEILQQFADGKIVAKNQAKQGVIYAKKISKEDEKIDWNIENYYVLKKIKSLSPFPGAKAKINGETIKVLDAHLVNSNSNEGPGTILSDDFCIKCGKEAIKITTLQRPGRKVMTAKEVLNGWDVVKGMKAKKI